MPANLNRRRFLRAAALAGVAGAASSSHATAGSRPDATRPVVIASGNGLTATNGGDLSCVEHAFERITSGADVLDALVEGVNIVELDPTDTSVGYGGLPDADGVVTLDSCCMHGPQRRAGGVACLKGVRTPSSVARAVADVTDHHLLVDTGAQTFARNMGFTIEDDLNTPRSRALWLEWKRRTDSQHYPDPDSQASASSRAAAGHRVGQQMVAEGKVHPEHFYGTINCNGVNGRGDVCGVTTTSGLAWKIPGRVGDSPILGAGLYVDNNVGAAGSTGRGEANLYSLASFLIIEFMRQGMTPRAAGLAALERIAANTVDPRLLTNSGKPNFNVTFYVLAKDGDHAGVAFYGSDEHNYAVCDGNGPRHEPIIALLGVREDPEH